MIEMLPPSAVRAAKRNARTHGKAQQEAVAHSIRTIGLIQPVVIDEQNHIVGVMSCGMQQRAWAYADSCDPRFAPLRDRRQVIVVSLRNG